MKSKLIGNYIVVESSKNEGEFELSNSKVKGFFTSVKELIKHLKSDALEFFDLNGGGVHEGHNEDWGSDLLVCKVVRVCRQVPIVKVSSSLKNVNPKEDK
ncbi:hypothetical protein ACFLQL_03010 [Verrucomicrobiota bacterium]